MKQERTFKVRKGFSSISPGKIRKSVPHQDKRRKVEEREVLKTLRDPDKNGSSA